MNMRYQNGFTLLEVLVALVILALTMSGLVTSVGEGAHNQNAIEERTFAQWVALNQIAKMQLSKSTVTPGNSDGIWEMAGRQWEWQQHIEKTSDPFVYRIIVTAGREEQQSELARATGYLLVRNEN
jgi:general secretion pathway protein I